MKPQQIIGELLKAEVAEKEARSIKYQLTIAKLPLAKDLTDFDFKGTPINAARYGKLHFVYETSPCGYGLYRAGLDDIAMMRQAVE